MVYFLKSINESKTSPSTFIFLMNLFYVFISSKLAYPCNLDSVQMIDGGVDNNGRVPYCQCREQQRFECFGEPARPPIYLGNNSNLVYDLNAYDIETYIVATAFDVLRKR